MSRSLDSTQSAIPDPTHYMSTEAFKHPFLEQTFHIKWSRLSADHIQADIDKALTNAQSKIDAIASATGPRTFENTLSALEEACSELNFAWRKVGHLDNVCNSPDLRTAYNKILPKVTDFSTQIHLNEGLWNAIKSFSETSEAVSLNGSRKRLLNETLEDFKESGADLSDDDKNRLKAINAELAKKTQQYAENVLDATNAWECIIKDSKSLEGFPQSALDAAEASAKSKSPEDTSPAWRFTLQAPSLLPLLTYANSRALREKAWKASNQVGRKDPYKNEPLVWDILALRDEKAKLLGFAHFADYTTHRRMVKSGQHALQFIEDLHERTHALFHTEFDALTQYRASQEGEETDPIQPWDSTYWSEKQRKERYDFDEESLRPYFSIDRVISGLFELVEKVFSVSISERNDVETWHEDVRFYEIHDSDDRHMGSFYADWHPRDSKRAGAWMAELKTGGYDSEGNWEPHLGVICGNLTPPVGDQPALLTHREVETIFHEFGHLFHHLSGTVDIRSLNGIHVVWDFVELPSQIMENWCWERESLDLFARHIDTDKPIPDALFDKMNAARNYQAAMATMRQLSFGKLDLELHMNYEQFKGEALDELIQRLLKDYCYQYPDEQPSIACRFTHLFADSTGYAAGYYSYKWAEVLDADAFTQFKDQGILNPTTGKAFRECILSKGNSKAADELFRDFMGRDPSINALLERSGLLKA